MFDWSSGFYFEKCGSFPEDVSSTRIPQPKNKCPTIYKKKSPMGQYFLVKFGQKIYPPSIIKSGRTLPNSLPALGTWRRSELMRRDWPPCYPLWLNYNADLLIGCFCPVYLLLRSSSRDMDLLHKYIQSVGCFHSASEVYWPYTNDAHPNRSGRWIVIDSKRRKWKWFIQTSLWTKGFR